MPTMTRIKQILQTPVNRRYHTVTAVLSPTPGQHAKSMPNQAPGTTEIRDYPAETEVMPTQTKASTTILTYLQPSANLQSP